mmetsp:Transcript_5437/g.16474  ORF Transcript_5437/g.16474 Transcript_5437/m.16474 type:complete len:102 (-) Transcript_5437:32-337(-)
MMQPSVVSSGKVFTIINMVTLQFVLKEQAQKLQKVLFVDGEQLQMLYNMDTLLKFSMKYKMLSTLWICLLFMSKKVNLLMMMMNIMTLLILVASLLKVHTK